MVRRNCDGNLSSPWSNVSICKPLATHLQSTWFLMRIYPFTPQFSVDISIVFEVESVNRHFYEYRTLAYVYHAVKQNVLNIPQAVKCHTKENLCVVPKDGGAERNGSWPAVKNKKKAHNFPLAVNYGVFSSCVDSVRSLSYFSCGLLWSEDDHINSWLRSS